ncbi:hypothetical protein KFV02_04860 [Desulfohalobiaceae bacterium Ax17]|uniref:hypothetical protein n=1 Tax=Desulfovulcanus ferrireducens TaxID=2831190 RepID=UPI00207BA646|nr:hypothetical protein [Desulfovulcanus ferrireducens]MBT8763259.1 hypothetical protein [Desulfovulcanus ferrireducens]
MPNYIVSPCGTSLLTGGADGETRALLTRYANYKNPGDIEPEHRSLLEKRVQKVKEELFALGPAGVTRRSAELNALVKFYNGRFMAGDYHFLLCTDTWLGEQTGTMIRDWLIKQNDKMSVEVHRQTDLQTENMLSFQLALTELAELFDSTLPGYRQNQYHIVFNLTGGFKSVQGFLQVIAMFYADEIIYVFESGSTLLRIPRLPIQIDMEGGIKKNISLFRRLEARLLKPEEAERLPEIFVFRLEEEVDFSPWGKVVWNRAKEVLYRERLWPEPVEYVRFSEKFVKQINGLPEARKKEMNDRIDQLIRCLRDEGFNPRSLRFHPIEGKAMEPCTHEFYAWTGEGDRVYGYFEGNVFVVDRLDEHL